MKMFMCSINQNENITGQCSCKSTMKVSFVSLWENCEVTSDMFVFYIFQDVLETLTHPHYSCPKQIIKKGFVMFHRPESKFMGWQYKNHCPISSQKSGGRPSENEKQAWLTEVNNHRIKINSFKKSVKDDKTLSKPGNVQNWQQLKRKQSGELSSRKYRQYNTDVLGYGEQLLENCRKFAVNNQTHVKRSCQLLFLKRSKAAMGSSNRYRPGQWETHAPEQGISGRRMSFVRDSGSDSEPQQLQLIQPHWTAEGGEKPPSNNTHLWPSNPSENSATFPLICLLLLGMRRSNSIRTELLAPFLWTVLELTRVEMTNFLYRSPIFTSRPWF